VFKYCIEAQAVIYMHSVRPTTSSTNIDVNTITTGIKVVKNDPVVDDLPLDLNETQSINLQYDIKQLYDTYQVRRIPGGKIELNYPVESTSQFENLQFIESQFAEYNKRDIDTEQINKVIINLVPYCLKKEGVELPQDPKTAARVKTLIFKQVRDIKSTEKTIKYLNGTHDLTQLLGPRADCIDVSPSTYSSVRGTFGMGRQQVQDAIRRLQHILYRNGLLVDTLSDVRYTPGQAIPPGKELPNVLRSRALINWAELLLEQLTDGISFGRFGETHSVREVIAAIAYRAIEKNNKKRENLHQLTYSNDLITTTQIRNIIYDNIAQDNFLISKQALEHILTELHRNLFKFASDELGFFSQPIDIAIDPTWLSLEKKMDPKKIPGAMGNIKLDGNSGFKFATGASFTPMSRFSLGVSLVTDKSVLSEIYRRLIFVLEEFGSIGWILADREFDDPKHIELARAKAGNSWAIRLRDHKKVIDKKEYRQLRNDKKATISIGDTEVNAFWKNLSNSDFEWVFKKEDDDKLILMSGLPLDETNITELSSIYSSRWSAETHIRQLKEDFSPKISREYAFDYLFYLNISSIFYNIHKIINQSLSPTYGLPLRPRYYEVLWAIAHSTFQCRCPI
jgi:hypothetical protein